MTIFLIVFKNTHQRTAGLEHILTQTLKCLLNLALRGRQIHADTARTVERASILPCNSDIPTSSKQLIEALFMLLTLFRTVEKQHISSLRFGHFHTVEMILDIVIRIIDVL